MCLTAAIPLSAQDLNGPWLMKDFTRGVGITKQLQLPGHLPKDCLPIQVPGTVREALLKAGEIPDPYFGYDNEKSLWVEQKEWWFFKTFTADMQLKGKWTDLVFEGTSFAGEVWLNGHALGELKGMLNPRTFDISKVLDFEHPNTLVVRLEATPDAWNNTMARGLTWRTPRDHMFSIAQCMYGWDWGPHGVPIGMWRPVRLRVSGSLRLDRPSVHTSILSAAQARCDIAIDIRNLSDAPRQAVISGAILEKDTQHKAAEFQQTITLAAGETRTLHASTDIRNPKLWWPNGMGAQNLYLLKTSASSEGLSSEASTTQFGIRELKLVENDRVDEFLKTMKEHVGDSHHLGNVVGSYPWTFQVNGKKMFAKGGNWIPADQLLRLGRDRYERLLGLARDAHYNLFRVWGGGLYETDDFYDLCDEYGILAWQEFLSNRSFSKIDRVNFLEGAQSAVLRLRNHPSLTFWCGGNEFDPDDQGSKAVIDSLGALLKKLDPEREFHRASPYMGDDHYWGVWHQKEPYTKYRILRPFRSEAGINAPPVLENYLKFTPEDKRWPLDPTYIEYRGESNTRFQHLEKLLRYANEFGESVSLPEFIRKSQLYQALGTEFDMEYCRSNKFRNSGFLVWQYNDIWPAVSWATVDWYGTPKPAYYFQKRASRPVHISADYERYLWKAGETFAADVYLLNDTEAPVKNARFTAKLLDLQGATLVEKSGLALADANQSEKIGRIEYLLPAAMTGKAFFLSVEVLDKSGAKLSDSLYPIAVSRSDDLQNYAGIFEEMNHMPSAGLKVKSGARSGKPGTLSLRITNPSAGVAFFTGIRLLEESADVKTTYSDNFISLLPGESKTLTVRVEGASSAALHFEISGWNAPAQTVEVH